MGNDILIISILLITQGHNVLIENLDMKRKIRIKKNKSNRFFLIVGLVCSLMYFDSTAQSKKNLLFIMTDQLRYDALTIAGNTVIKTPNLDRLAKQGAFFTNAYTPCAVCGPARSSILTGCRVESTGVKSNSETYYYSDSEVMTMPTFDEILNDNGYHCEYYGKWHAMTRSAEIYKNPVLQASNGSSVFGPSGQSYIWRDYIYSFGAVPEPVDGQFKEDLSKFPYIANPLDFYFGKTWEQLQAEGLKHSQPDQHGQLLLDKDLTLTAYQAQQTIEALERLKDKTFSLTCSFHFPHSPMTVPEPYYSMYAHGDIPLPISLNDNMANSPYYNSNGRTKHPEYADGNKIKYMIAEYYGIITEIDDWVGKILDKLEELGIAEKTMIIFTSDHGEMLGSHGMREKNVFLEESAHIPLFISSLGDINAQSTVEGYVSLVDLFPTILDYLNVPDAPSDGKSLRGLINGTDTEHGQYVVTEWDRDNTPNYMVVKDGWKLMIPYTIHSTVINAMYDLNSDPYEMNNLLGNNPNRTIYLQKAEELRTCLLEWLEKNNSIHYYSVSQRDLLNGGRPTGNNGVVVSTKVSDVVKGEPVTVEVIMKNTGSSTWKKETGIKLATLISGNGEQEFVELEAGEEIVPGGLKTFLFTIQVSDIDGEYNYQWQLMQEGEELFGEQTELIQVVIGQPKYYLDDCDKLEGWSSSQSLKMDNVAQKQGLGCLNFEGSTTDEYKKVFTTPFNAQSDFNSAALQFWYYVSEPSFLSNNNQVELGSGGKADVNEYSWNLSGLVSGWNFITLPVKDADIKGTPDLQAINWFRLYNKKTGSVSSRIDGIWLGTPEVSAINDMVEGSSNCEVTVKPNPIDVNCLYLHIKGFKKNKEMSVSVYDLNGSVILSRDILCKDDVLIDALNLQPNSIYIVTVESNDLVASTKFITQ